MRKLSIIIFAILGTGHIYSSQAEIVKLNDSSQTFSLEDVEMITNEILIDIQETKEESHTESGSGESQKSIKKRVAKRNTPTGPAIGYVPDKAIAKLKASQQISITNKKVNKLYKQAFTKENTGNHTEALQLLNQLLHLNPAHHQARLAKGRLLIKTSQYEEAVEALLPLCSQDNDAWNPWYWIGSAQLMLGQLVAAEQSLDEALAREGTKAQIWLNRAIVEQERDDHNSALQLLSIANDLTPNDPHILLSVAYSSEAIGDLDNAVTSYRKFLTEAQKRPSTKHLRHTILAHLLQMELPQPL